VTRTAFEGSGFPEISGVFVAYAGFGI